MANDSLAVPSEVVDTTIRYVEASSLTIKRALDELSVHQAAQAKAAALRTQLVDHMIRSGVVAPNQKEAAEAMLGAHDTTMQLLKSAVDKIVEVQAENKAEKKASAIGTASPDPSLPSGSGNGTYNSLTDPVVGRRTSAVKESDMPLLRAAGLR